MGKSAILYTILFFACILLSGCTSPFSAPFPKECEGLGINEKQACIAKAAKAANSEDICNYIEYDDQKHQCQYSIVVEKGDYKLCDSLSYKYSSWCKSKLATEMSRCEKGMSDLIDENNCIIRIVTSKLDVNECDALSDSHRNFCKQYYVAYTKYHQCRDKLGPLFDSESFYGWCITKLAGDNFNPLLCEDNDLPLPSNGLIAKCYRSYAMKAKDGTYCDKAFEFDPNPSDRDYCKRMS